MFVILLTNRVHAATARRPAKVISDVRADLADAAELAVTDLEGGMLDMPKSFRADLAVGWNKPERVTRAQASRARRAAQAKARAKKASSHKSSASRSSSAKSSHASTSKSKSTKSKSSTAKKTASKSTHAKAHAG